MEFTGVAGAALEDATGLYLPFEETTVMGLTEPDTLGGDRGLRSIATGESMDFLSLFTSPRSGLSLLSNFVSSGTSVGFCSDDLLLLIPCPAEGSFLFLGFKISFNLGALDVRPAFEGGLFSISKDFDEMAGKESSESSGIGLCTTAFSGFSTGASFLSKPLEILAFFFSGLSDDSCLFSFLVSLCSFL